MTQRLSIALAVALAVAAPGAGLAKDKDKDKGKDKAKNAQSADWHDDDDEHERGDGRDRITICHKPDDGNGRTLTVSEEAWSGHRGHGDHLGSCGVGPIDRRTLGRFDDLDRNDDGVLSRREWPLGSAAFDRVDVNDDGLINRAEFSRL